MAFVTTLETFSYYNQKQSKHFVLHLQSKFLGKNWSLLLMI